MAAPVDPLLAYFTAMNNQGGVVVKDIPKLDLETYIQNYKGRTRFDRLLLIGQCSVPLCVDALKAAVAEAKKGKDIQRYRDAISLLRQAAPSEPESSLDRHWIEVAEKSNKDETRRLEQELKGYKNNMVRESILRGNEDIGKHLEAIGDLPGAAQAYSNMRPDCSTGKQIIEVGKHLVQIYLQRREWSSVINNLNKIATLQSQGDDKSLTTFVKVVHGVALLGQGKYQEASLTLLMADASTSPAAYYDVLSQNDVAVYGGLLALATMDRMEIQEKVLDNQNFRPFLELEPQLRRAITLFVNGRYSACLAILESYRADFLLDVHLHSHIPEVYSQIRSKCISQYLLPFSCVTLESLNQSFAIDGQSVEDELVAMIQGGILKARINTIDKVVTTTTVKPRAQMQMAALKTAQEYEREATGRLRRMNISAAELEVRMPRRFGSGGGQVTSGVTDDWFDDSGMQVA